MTDPPAGIDALLEAALEREGAAREEFLAALGQRDPAARDELVSLLAARDGAREFFGRLDPGELARELTESEDDWVGRRIGPWRIVSRLAVGGMGAVYKGERGDGAYRQVVALKLIQAGAGNALLRAGFLRERQLLAGLNHPGIAHLIDGGSTPDGQPYLAMEFVDGLPIDRHARERQLPVEARLRLFLDVCDAVQFAHRNLVIHRDLKPGNIFVDRAGRVKLLDFGIARVFEPA